ncbi:DNA-directed RNA polymerase subunit beta [Candidatus Shapirobacteria bacterium]|nr:DNA-directed RNA polymerase subunit beta [Candidatus Shapirobacteria bacterium]
MSSKDTPSQTYWGKDYSHLPALNLSAIQRQSWQWFLEKGFTSAFKDISPIEDFTGKNWLLELESIYWEKPLFGPAECREKRISYATPLRVNCRLTNKQTGKITQQPVFFADVPQMTSEGTFIINGIERAVVSQIVRSPGAYFTGEIDPSSGQMVYMAEIRPIRGSWLEFFISQNGIVSVRIDRRRKFIATTVLRAVAGFSDQELLDRFGPEIASTIEYDPTKTREEALLEIYRKMRPGEPIVLENAETFFNHLFFDPRRYELGEIGRYKANKRLGLALPNTPQNWVLTTEDFSAVVKYLFGLKKGNGRIDDIDHLANRRVRMVGELVLQTAVRPGLLRIERMVKERMSLVAPTQEGVMPVSLLNTRPLVVALNEFFRSNRLSTILDQTNPLSEIDNLRRLSVTGPGGLTRERASFSIRDVSSSQYGRICPVRTPEGPNIGLVTYLSLYARINEYGFLETPYRRVKKISRGKKALMKVTDEVVYLPADDEEEFHITSTGIEIDKNDIIREKLVPVRYHGEFLEAPVERVQLIDLVPRQVVGTAASLIPFLAHNEVNRDLMGAHMQCQAVPLVKTESPFVETGMETLVAESMGRISRARNSGTVVYTDADKVIVKTGESKQEKKGQQEADESGGNFTAAGDLDTYFVSKFKRTNPYGTCYSQRPVVSLGQKVKRGDLILDGPSIAGGKLSLGKNLVIAYCSFEGLGYEDALVISDRLVKEDVLTSISIEEHEAPVVDTKLGPEELTRDIPNVAEADLANLAEDGIVIVGAEVGPNDILVGKIAPKGETELTAEERLLRAIFGEKAREVRDTSLRMPHGEWGTVVDVSVLDRERGDELEPGTNKKVLVRVAQIRKVTEGDKLAGRYGNKGVISRIIPAADMPYLGNGEPVDIILSPISVLARMNLGQLLETQLGLAAKILGTKFAIPALERIPEERIFEALRKAGLPTSGKTRLYDGRTGEPFEQEVTVGIGYIMKLVHMVEDKVHARSTGPYSLVTQQPLGGKAQMGGQRLGEMEVWALEAHKAIYTLQEMLTIKSDDVIGRARAFEAIVKGSPIPTPMVPESFNVLVKELESLCLSVIPKGVVERVEEPEAAEVKTEATELAKAAGAEVVPEEGAPAVAVIEEGGEIT